MKNLKFAAVAAGLGLFSVVGFADTIPFNSVDTASSAVLDNSDCTDGAELDVSLEVTDYSAPDEDYLINRVRVTGAPADCEGAELTLTFLDQNGEAITGGNVVRTETIGANGAAGFGQFSYAGIGAGEVSAFAFLLEGETSFTVPAPAAQ